MTPEHCPQVHGARVTAIGKSFGPGSVALPQLPGIQPQQLAYVEAALLQCSPDPCGAGLKRVAGFGQRPSVQPDFQRCSGTGDGEQSLQQHGLSIHQPREQASPGEVDSNLRRHPTQLRGQRERIGDDVQHVGGRFAGCPP